MDLGIISAIAGGLGTGAAVGVWLVKREMSRVLEVVERVPDKEWFDRVERLPDKEWFDRVESKIDDLPSNARFEAHFKTSHEHAQVLQTHQLKIEKLERGHEDHEVRIRYIERPAGTVR